MNIKNKVVFITGSSKGIGKETALAFSKNGANVVVTYFNDKKAGDETLKECEKFSECLLVKLDVKSAESVKKAIENIVKKFGGIDILINNAGVLHDKYFKEQSLKELEEQIDINLKGPIKVTKIAFPHLEKRKKSLIINIASMSGKRTHEGHSAYGASKFGVRGFTQALSCELPDNMKVYAVNPEKTATSMTNFIGINPKEVADVVVKTAKEELGKKSGDDIDL